MTEGDDRAFLTPEDDPSMLDPPAVRGPLWWEGLWPDGGITSLADLQRYVESRLNDLISHVWSGPATFSDMGEMFGAQAARNAIRWLNIHGDTSPPMVETADFASPLDIENALHRILRHIRSRQGEFARVAASPDDSAGIPRETPLPSKNENEPVEGERDEAEKDLARCHHVAYGYYELAVQQCGRKLKDREAYDWLVENPQKLEGEELPEFETFRRYLTAYRNAHNISKYSAKRGRSHGPSVVRQNEL